MPSFNTYHNSLPRWEFTYCKLPILLKAFFAHDFQILFGNPTTNLTCSKQNTNAFVGHPTKDLEQTHPMASLLLSQIHFHKAPLSLEEGRLGLTQAPFNIQWAKTLLPYCRNSFDPHEAHFLCLYSNPIRHLCCQEGPPLSSFDMGLEWANPSCGLAQKSMSLTPVRHSQMPVTLPRKSIVQMKRWFDVVPPRVNSIHQKWSCVSVFQTRLKNSE